MYFVVVGAVAALVAANAATQATGVAFMLDLLVVLLGCAIICIGVDKLKERVQ